MPLSSEIAYWDGVADKIVRGNSIIKDNIWKRRHQLQRLLEYGWIDENVLEIGVGTGIVAGALKLIALNNMKYIGTELSEKFRECTKASFHLDTVKADVRELPGTGYSRIIALDSLEHVRPEHRAEGYSRIASVAAKDALLFIHYSKSLSLHDKEFDHPFGLPDIVALE